MDLDDVVFVPVETRYVDEVTHRLRQLRSDEDAATGVSPSDSRVNPVARARDFGSNHGGRQWTADEYDRFTGESRTSYVRIAAMKDVLAGTPGTRILLADIAAEFECSRSGLTQALSKYSSWTKRNLDDDVWPFGWIKKSNGEFEYWMEPDQARAWRAARERAE